MTYYLQVICTKKWDEVPEDVFRNFNQYLNMDGSIRYNGNSFSRTPNGNIVIHCQVALTQEDLAIITRICGAEKSAPPILHGNAVSTPAMLLRKRKNSLVLLNLKTGETFKKVAS